MAHRVGSQSGPKPALDDPEVQSYLRDYLTLLNTLPHPSAVFDHRWDVMFANPAFDVLFRHIPPHPTAMPGDNLLRFVLFHPDASSVLGEHEASWCLPMMAHLAEALEEHGQDSVLQSIRRDVAQDPIMEAAYRQGLPHWLRTVGPRAVAHDGPVRPLCHPDPRWGCTYCRVVCDTPRTLEVLGYRHLTFVLREPSAPSRTGHSAPRPADTVRHLSAVPTVDA
jgi:hypothetical protein